MTWVDFTIIAILAVSASIGIFRGFIKEAFSLLNLIVSFWVALTFFGDLATILATYMQQSAPIRSAIAFFMLLIMALITGTMLSHITVAILDKSGLSGINRFLGMLFGLIRGVVVVGFLVLVAEKTMLPNDDAWQKAMLLKYADPLVTWLGSLVPAELNKYMNPDELNRYIDPGDIVLSRT